MKRRTFFQSIGAVIAGVFASKQAHAKPVIECRRFEDLRAMFLDIQKTVASYDDMQVIQADDPVQLLIGFTGFTADDRISIRWVIRLTHVKVTAYNLPDELRAMLIATSDRANIAARLTQGEQLV